MTAEVPDIPTAAPPKGLKSLGGKAAPPPPTPVAGATKLAPVAVAHFRFELEEVAPVLYLYELMVDPIVQRKGLGLFLLRLLELVARKQQMEWLMATVPQACEGVFKAMSKAGWTLDMEVRSIYYIYVVNEERQG